MQAVVSTFLNMRGHICMRAVGNPGRSEPPILQRRRFAGSLLHTAGRRCPGASRRLGPVVRMR